MEGEVGKEKTLSPLSAVWWGGGGTDYGEKRGAPSEKKVRARDGWGQGLMASTIPIRPTVWKTPGTRQGGEIGGR